MSVNKVILLGRLGQDPEMRMTQNGVPVATVSLATSEKYKGRDGQAKETTEWHRCVLWDKKAELAGKYLRKGNLVYFEGKLKTRQWEDQQGQKKYTTEIVVDTISFCEKAQNSEGGQGQSNRGYQPPQQNSQPQYGDEDVPF